MLVFRVLGGAILVVRVLLVFLQHRQQTRAVLFQGRVSSINLIGFMVLIISSSVGICALIWQLCSLLFCGFRCIRGMFPPLAFSKIVVISAATETPFCYQVIVDATDCPSQFHSGWHWFLSGCRVHFSYKVSCFPLCSAANFSPMSPSCKSSSRFCIVRVSSTFSSFMSSVMFNTLRTGDADLRFYITTVQDG